MNNDIKPIETIYNGYRFRSRLEARWAVFFDALNIKWEYEPEGFELSNGEKYLPDFYLPTFSGGMYVEVKPDGGDFSKAIFFARDAGVGVWLAEGVPNLREYRVVYPNQQDLPVTDDECPTYGIPNYDQAWGENRMYVCPEGCDKVTHMLSSSSYTWKGEVSDKAVDLLNAIKQARSARFEFGENDWVR